MWSIMKSPFMLILEIQPSLCEACLTFHFYLENMVKMRGQCLSVSYYLGASKEGVFEYLQYSNMKNYRVLLGCPRNTKRKTKKVTAKTTKLVLSALVRSDVMSYV